MVAEMKNIESYLQHVNSSNLTPDTDVHTFIRLS